MAPLPEHRRNAQLIADLIKVLLDHLARVPEVWLLRGDQIAIYRLQNEGYRLQSDSRYFSNVNLQAVIPECLRTAYERNTSVAIRELRRAYSAKD